MYYTALKSAALILLLFLTSTAYGEQDTAPDFSCDPRGRERQQLRLRRQTRQPRLRRRDLLPHRPCARKPLSHKRPAPVQQPVRVRQPLGYGWALNYDKRIYTYPDGSVTLRKECGWKIRFTWSTAGYLPSTGETGALVQNVDGSFLYTDKSGEKETYDPRAGSRA